MRVSEMSNRVNSLLSLVNDDLGNEETWLVLADALQEDGEDGIAALGELIVLAENGYDIEDQLKERLNIINPGDSYRNNLFDIRLGAYGELSYIVWASSLDDALEIVIDYIIDSDQCGVFTDLAEDIDGEEPDVTDMYIIGHTVVPGMRCPAIPCWEVNGWQISDDEILQTAYIISLLIEIFTFKKS